MEILFGEGLIKVLFATETFSIGINMPAKTVVFTDLKKFDGFQSRYVTCGEYIQMSGRAGRRGKDDRGIVIQMVSSAVPPEEAKKILYGEAEAERVSAAARAQAALPRAVEIYYLPAAKGSSALNYAPRRQQPALRSNPL